MKGSENSRCETNPSGIPGDEIVVSTSHVAEGLTVSEDKVHARSARTTWGMSEWRSLSGRREKGVNLDLKG